MAPISCSKFRVTINKGLKNLNAYSFANGPTVSILSSTKSSLEFFYSSPRKSASSSDASFGLPDPEEAYVYLKDPLPQPSQIFTDSFFIMPIFAISVLVYMPTLCVFSEFSP